MIVPLGYLGNRSLEAVEGLRDGRIVRAFFVGRKVAYRS